MLMLDLFSGLGGASKAMKERGWQVITVDIDPKFNPSIVADIREFHYDGDRPDLVWASPPCVEFTLTVLPRSWVKRKPNPDIALLKEAQRVIAEANPRYWVIENVRGAVPYFNAILGPVKKKVGNQYLWGEFPIFDTPPKLGKRYGWKTATERAIIPKGISLALCLAIEHELASKVG
jgi:site-specific DNA-cytosine methylase